MAITRIWLDDERPCPADWTWLKTVQEVKEALMSNDVEYMSLDHDLGAPKCPGACWGDQGVLCDMKCVCQCHQLYPNGYSLVCWMVERNKWPKNKPHVHSQNSVGAIAMRETIDRYGPYQEKP